MDKNLLEIGFVEGDNLDNVTQSLTLKTIGVNGSTIHWKSEHESVITVEGIVTRPSFTNGDIRVTLTATIQKGEFSQQKSFSLLVKKLPITEEEQKLQQAKTDLSEVIQNVNMTDAKNAQNNYLIAQGDTTLEVYTEVTTKLDSLNNAITEANKLLNSNNITLLELQNAKSDILLKQTELDQIVELLENATQELKTKYEEAKEALQTTIENLDISKAETALSGYLAAKGSESDSVYLEVITKLNALNDSKKEAGNLLNSNNATLQELQNSKSDILQKQTELDQKVESLENATQELETKYEEAKEALETAIVNLDASKAQTALTEYLTAQGNVDNIIYTNVTQAVENLIKAKNDAQSLLNNPNTNLQDIQEATSNIAQLQNTLDERVELLVEATKKLIQDFDNAKQTLLNAITNVDLTFAQQAQTEYVEKGGDENASSYTEVTSAITNYQHKISEAEKIDLTIEHLNEILQATREIEESKTLLEEKVASLKEATEAIVLPEKSSKTISNFNFSTKYAGQVTAISKEIETSDFSSNPKQFTINDGKGNTIPVILNWNIIQNEYVTTPAASIGSAVESTIQQYFLDKEGESGLYNRTLSATGIWNGNSYGNTFKIQSFQPGSTETITLDGPDWSYFFEQQTFRGTDEDTSLNRTFTISDGSKTASITLNWNVEDIDGLVATINEELQDQQVKITAEKTSENTFKLVGQRANITIIIDGINKTEFFNVD